MEHKQKKVIIVHGWEASPENHWFPWLKSELEKFGCKVSIPSMPNTNHPTMLEWAEHLRHIIGKPNEDTYLVGHSLGSVAILRYLESLAEGEKIGGAVLVAGFLEPIEYAELDSFFATPFDFEKIRGKIRKIISIHSGNDQVVPIENSQSMKDNLGAEQIIVQNAGHFNEGDGFTEFPIMLQKMRELMNI